jgi:hypothetical protein
MVEALKAQLLLIEIPRWTEEDRQGFPLSLQRNVHAAASALSGSDALDSDDLAADRFHRAGIVASAASAVPRLPICLRWRGDPSQRCQTEHECRDFLHR